jgi:hypothetical protein
LPDKSCYGFKLIILNNEKYYFNPFYNWGRVWAA